MGINRIYYYTIPFSGKKIKLLDNSRFSTTEMKLDLEETKILMASISNYNIDVYPIYTLAVQVGKLDNYQQFA